MGNNRQALVVGLMSIVACVAFTGCSPTRDDVPGTVPYGSVEQVAQRSTGSGEANSLDRLGVLPLAEWPKPKVPRTAPIRSASWWLIPQTSRDGLTQREGVWMHSFIDTKPRWGLELYMDQVQPLSALTDLANGPQGGLTFATSAVPEHLSRGIQRFGATYRLPFMRLPFAPSTPVTDARNTQRPQQAVPPQSLPAPTSTVPSR